MDLQTLIDKLPTTIELCYVDYNDKLHSAESIRQVMWWEFDATHYWYTREIVDQIIMDTYTEEEQEFLRENEEIRQAISDEIYSRDTSDPSRQLAKNTNTWFRYDLDIEIPDLDYMSKSEYNKLIRQLTKRFSRFWYKENHIRNMVANAPYWWQLYMLWYGSVSDIVYDKHFGQKYATIWWELICFDANNWSWRGTEQLVYVTVQRNEDNLILDDLDTGYWYATDLCGLCPSYYDWDISFHKTATSYLKTNKWKSQATIHREEQEKFEDVYRKWWCSFEDSKMSRHRNVKYINNYPCGWKCENCWRFWID